MKGLTSTPQRRIQALRIFASIPLKRELEELMLFCHLHRVRGRLDGLEALVEEAYGLLDPKAVYVRVEVSKVEGEHLVLGRRWALESRLLAEKFKCTQELAVYVATVGHALEERVSELGSMELSKSFILDCAGTYALHQVCDVIRRDFHPDGWERVSAFSPGSTDYWDISQQRILFDVLGSKRVWERIGVRLNESYVMIPKKSVSGIMGVTEEPFQECQVCKRRCEYRRAPFTPDSDPLHG